MVQTLSDLLSFIFIFVLCKKFTILHHAHCLNRHNRPTCRKASSAQIIPHLKHLYDRIYSYLNNNLRILNQQQPHFCLCCWHETRQHRRCYDLRVAMLHNNCAKVMAYAIAISQPNGGSTYIALCTTTICDVECCCLVYGFDYSFPLLYFASFFVGFCCCVVLIVWIIIRKSKLYRTIVITMSVFLILSHTVLSFLTIPFLNISHHWILCIVNFLVVIFFFLSFFLNST